jgi:ABC-type multidrug transport system fused ATPase/permease subunit
VSFFGYSTFLTTPLRTGIEYIIATTRAFVAANKVQRVLRVTPDIADEGTAAWPAQWQRVIDATSGLTLSRGHLVGLVTESPDEAVEIADRIGRFSHAADVTIDDVAATSIRLSDYRRHLVVSEIEPRLFAGTLRHEMTLRDTPDDERLLAALTTTSATDIVDGLDGGLDAWIEERGRGLSGGQRQRLALTRALLTDAEIVVLVEPTSAVDAHTERRIARALPLARAGRTTLVTTSSPIMLEQCDRVVVVRDGRVVASGTHDELCRDAATYRHIVLREDL